MVSEFAKPCALRECIGGRGGARTPDLTDVNRAL
jgi:hypothetical protein